MVASICGDEVCPSDSVPAFIPSLTSGLATLIVCARFSQRVLRTQEIRHPSTALLGLHPRDLLCRDMNSVVIALSKSTNLPGKASSLCARYCRGARAGQIRPLPVLRFVQLRVSASTLRTATTDQAPECRSSRARTPALRRLRKRAHRQRFRSRDSRGWKVRQDSTPSLPTKGGSLFGSWRRVWAAHKLWLSKRDYRDPIMRRRDSAQGSQSEHSRLTGPQHRFLGCGKIAEINIPLNPVVYRSFPN